MTPLAWQRIGVFGLGRSGLAVARAAIRRGAAVRILDEAPTGHVAKPELVAEARDLGAEVAIGPIDPETVAAWANAVVVNPAVRKDHPVLLELAARTDVIGEIEFASQISAAPIVALTGTNGKSTTTVLTYLALRACGVEAVLCGNIFGSGYPEQPLTDAADASHPRQVLVAEVSSFQLEWVRQFRPIAAGITNITPDHLDRYASFAEYAATKRRIWAAQGPGDFAICRAHDPNVPPPANGPTVWRFGPTAEEARLEDTQWSFFGQIVPISGFPFPETHNRMNAAMAALLAQATLARVLPERVATANAARVSSMMAMRSVYSGRFDPPAHTLVPEILDGLREFRGLAHRMEAVGARDGVRVINNSMCTNPDAVVKSVQAVRDSVHVILGGTNKGLDFLPLRSLLAQGRHRAYLFGRDAEDIRRVIDPTLPIYETMGDAFRAAAAQARAGEVIMLAPGCASSDQFRDFRHRGDVFRELAKEWLNELTARTD
ncbi:MAG: UDP-N-acetylmuramoyl-L-alanine--D-glutamate ligase [Fimbriimonadaceae bacterium]|nr:UDP-N-acetylmuramoyl-L-alanine--D-glutamate ligase [Fimbriimonadaceae bacterium]